MGTLGRILLGLAMLGTLSAGAAAQSVADAADALHIKFPDDRLQVNGLAWFTEDRSVLRRLPSRLKDTFRPPVWELAQQPSGGRIRFRTDSTRLAVVAHNPDTSTMHHMTSIGQSGIDLYVDGEYRNSAWPDAKAQIIREWALGEEPRMREVTLYLPLYKGLTVERLSLDPGATIGVPSSFALSRPVVFYGSSITQGGCAENPGLSYPAIVARSLNVDFVNLGFSGNGLGEPAVAQALAEIDASAFVLDYWANPSPAVYRDTLPGVVDTLRARHPQTPILLTGAYWFSGEASSASLRAQQEEKRRIAREFVAARRTSGDRALLFVDGLEMLSREQAAGLVDGVHANALGFHYCARGLEPHLRRALNLPGAGR